MPINIQEKGQYSARINMLGTPQGPCSLETRASGELNSNRASLPNWTSNLGLECRSSVGILLQDRFAIFVGRSCSIFAMIHLTPLSPTPSTAAPRDRTRRPSVAQIQRRDFTSIPDLSPRAQLAPKRGRERLQPGRNKLLRHARRRFFGCLTDAFSSAHQGCSAFRSDHTTIF